MSKTTYLYKTGKYFSPAGRAVGWVVSAIGLICIVNGAVIGWVLVPMAVVMQIAYNILEFYLRDKTYREGILLLGLKLGKQLPLPGFDFLFLKQNNYSKLAESRGSMTQLHSAKFDGYVKLSDGVKLRLLQRGSKAAALQQLEAVAQDLQTELRDLTEVKR